MTQPKMIEEKHRCRQVLSMKTRGQATLLRGERFSGIPGLLLAKSGISPPENCVDQNGYMVDLYLNRQPGQKSMTRPFVSVRDQWIKEIDVFRLEREVTMNLEYDFKRRPVRPRMICAGEQSHLAFDTEPWASVHDGERARTMFDEWRKTRCLKTVQDFEDWNDHFLCITTFDRLRREGKTVRFQVTKEGSCGILKRVLLAAYSRGAWGLRRQMAFKELAEQLTTLGFPTSIDDVKNAGRAGTKLQENIVPRTPRAIEMWGQVLLWFGELFEGFDDSKLFAPLV